MALNDIREKIDSIDDGIVKLLNERMDTVRQVAMSKMQTGKAIRDHARERSIVNRVTLQAGEEYAPYVKDIYKLMFELTSNYQARIMGKVSPLGQQIEAACNAAKTVKGKPTAIVQKTVKGKGVSFMENQCSWHGAAPKQAEYDIAMAELTARLQELEG